MRHVLTVIICWTAIHVTYAQQPFEDVTQQAGLEGLSGGVAAWVDFDRDGWCVQIRWPDGTRQEIAAQADQSITVEWKTPDGASAKQ